MAAMAGTDTNRKVAISVHLNRKISLNRCRGGGGDAGAANGVNISLGGVTADDGASDVSL